MAVAFLRGILLSTLALPGALAAQWRVSVTPPSGAHAATVTAVVREVADSLVEEGAVSFVVRCSARQLEAFLTTNDQLDSDTNGDVRLRVQADSLRPRDVRWQATKANTGAFVSPPDLRDLVQRGILRSHELRITAATQKRGRVTFTFNVSGFVPSLDALRDACPNDRGTVLAMPAR